MSLPPYAYSFSIINRHALLHSQKVLALIKVYVILQMTYNGLQRGDDEPMTLFTIKLFVTKSAIIDLT